MASALQQKVVYEPQRQRHKPGSGKQTMKIHEDAPENRDTITVKRGKQQSTEKSSKRHSETDIRVAMIVPWLVRHHTTKMQQAHANGTLKTHKNKC
jgi:hypothetical protein